MPSESRLADSKKLKNFYLKSKVEQIFPKKNFFLGLVLSP